MKPEAQILLDRIDNLNNLRNIMPEQMAGVRKRLWLEMSALAHKAEAVCGIRNQTHRRKLVLEWRRKLLV